jgi:hypothetical protein
MKTNTKTTKNVKSAKATKAVKEVSADLAPAELTPKYENMELKTLDSTIMKNRESVATLLTKNIELDRHIAKLQSENSKHLKFQAKVAVIIDKLDEVNTLFTFPKKVNLAWILANLTKLPKLIAIVKDAIEEIKVIKNS